MISYYVTIELETGERKGFVHCTQIQSGNLANSLMLVGEVEARADEEVDGVPFTILSISKL